MMMMMTTMRPWVHLHGWWCDSVLSYWWILWTIEMKSNPMNPMVCTRSYFNHVQPSKQKKTWMNFACPSWKHHARPVLDVETTKWDYAGAREFLRNSNGSFWPHSSARLAQWGHCWSQNLGCFSKLGSHKKPLAFKKFNVRMTLGHPNF